MNVLGTNILYEQFYKIIPIALLSEILIVAHLIFTVCENCGVSKTLEKV